MRLRQKISLIVVVLTTAAVLACSGLTLYSLARSNLELAISYGKSNHEVRFNSWKTAVERGITESSPSARRSVARYYAQLFADDGTILMMDGEEVYNPTAFSPDATYEVGSSHPAHTVIGQNGVHLLLVGQKTLLKDETYYFYELSDISAVYKSIETMAIRFFVVDGLVILLTAALSLWLTGRALKPLNSLKKATAKIAGGVYDQRIPVTSNDEVGELASHFNSMADAVEHHVEELKQDAERQTMLLSALTHELKTPLTGIKGNAETLLMTQMTEEEQQDALIYIDEECTRVERLSQKLMQLISLREQGRLTLKPCSVRELFAQVEASCEEQLRQRRLNLVIDDTRMETVNAEFDLMVSLLLNLIDNAGKASHSGDVLLLSAERNRFSVRDFGRGIPQAEIDKITQPFYMVDKSRARRSGGIGLGLALVQEIALLHGAELEIESVLGEGTTVSVVFGENEE